MDIGARFKALGRLSVGFVALATFVAVGCGGDGSQSESTTSTSSTGRRVPKVQCYTGVSDFVPPVVDDFEQRCSVFPINSDEGRTTRVVDGHYELVLAEGSWTGWLDLHRRVDELRVAVMASLPTSGTTVRSTTLPSGTITLVCLGPRPKLNSYRFAVGTTPDAAHVFLVKAPEGRDAEPITDAALDPVPFREPVRLEFSCVSGSNGVDLVGMVNGKVAVNATVAQTDGFVPFNAAGLRFDNYNADPAANPVTFVIDDVAVNAKG